MQDISNGYSKEIAIKDEAALKQGNIDEKIDWPLAISEKVIKVNNTNVKSFLILGRFQVCDVEFEGKLLFIRMAIG